MCIRDSVRPSRTTQQGVDPREKLHQSERLGHVVVRPEAEAAYLVGFLTERGEHEHRRRIAVIAQRPQHAIPIGVRQHQIEHDDVGPLLPCERQARRAIVRTEDAVALELEVTLQSPGELLVILDKKNCGHAHERLAELGPPFGRQRAAGVHRRRSMPSMDRSSGRGRFDAERSAGSWMAVPVGSSMTTRAPPPAASSTYASPRCSAVSSRTTANPIPLPSCATLVSRRSRTYGLQIRLRSITGIPGPWSSTANRARESTRSTMSLTVWPGGPNLSALSSRFSTICRTALLSTLATTD